MTSSQIPSPDKSKKDTKTLPIIPIIGVLLLFLCICLACIVSIGLWEYSDSGQRYTGEPVLAIAMNLDEKTPSIYLFVGNAESDVWMLPGGSYYLEILKTQNVVLMPGVVEISQPQGAMNLETYLSRDSGNTLPEKTTQLMLIANLLTGIQQGELAYLAVASEDFNVPLFSSQNEITAAELQSISNRYTSVLENEEATIQAVKAFEARAIKAAGLSACPEVCKPDQGMLDALLGFFREMGQVNNRAVDDILLGSASMSEEEKSDAFEYMQPSMIGDAQNFDELVNKLQNGELDDQANRIRSFLMDEPTFVETLTEIKGSNRVLLETAHEEGSVLVQKGAELEVQIIKQVLQSSFPGIEQGFDYADKVNEWSEFIRKTYTDPAGSATDLITGDANNRIKEQIKNGLLDMGYSEEMAGDMAGYLSQEIVTELTKKDPELVAQATKNSQPTLEEITKIPANATTQVQQNDTIIASATPDLSCQAPDNIQMNGAFESTLSYLSGTLWENNIIIQLSPCGGPAGGTGEYKRGTEYDAQIVTEDFVFTGTCLNEVCSGTVSIHLVATTPEMGNQVAADSELDCDWNGTYMEGAFEGAIYTPSYGTWHFTLVE